jgi:hypothetical protein
MAVTHHVIREDRRRVVEGVPPGVGCRVRRVMGIVGRPEPGQARGGAHQRAIAHVRAPGPGVAEGAALGEHQSGVQFSQPRRRETKRGKGSRLEVGEHGDASADQVGEHFGTARMAQVQAEAQVVAVCPGEGVADRLAGPGLTQAVGKGGALDLDHLGTEVAEQPAQLAAGHDHAEVDDPQPGQRQATA